MDDLDNLINLKVLYLNDNKIQKIEGMNNLTNLTELYLCYNRIESI